MTAMANFKRNVLLRNIQSFLMPSLSNGTSHILPQFTWHCGRRALCTVFLPICSICISNHAGNLNASRKLQASRSPGRRLCTMYMYTHNLKSRMPYETMPPSSCFSLYFFFRQALNVIYITKTWFKFGTKWLEFHEFHLNS